MFQQESFIEECRRALLEHSPKLAVKEVVQRAVADPAGIQRALGAPTRAGINSVYRSPELTILNVVWAPLMSIFPHDHRMWAVIGIYGGQEDNTFYRRAASGVGLERINGKSLVDSETIILGDEVIHAVENPRRAYTGAIHVYGGDFFAVARSAWESETSPESPYDPEQTKQQFADAEERAKQLLAT